MYLWLSLFKSVLPGFQSWVVCSLLSSESALFILDVRSFTRCVLHSGFLAVDGLLFYVPKSVFRRVEELLLMKSSLLICSL